MFNANIATQVISPAADGQDQSAQRPGRKKTGGRKAGTPNKKTQALRDAVAAVLLPGQDPRTFFAAILRNDELPIELRFAAAKELAPLMHPRLAAIRVPRGVQTHEDRLQELHDLLAAAPIPIYVTDEILNEKGSG
jgi:hypothetical protein